MTLTIKWQGINPKNGKLATVGTSIVTVTSDHVDHAPARRLHR